MNKFQFGLRGRIRSIMALLVVALAAVAAARPLTLGGRNDSLLVNLAGRQRMLSQRMTKEALDYAQGRDPAMLESFGKTVELFDRTVRALRFGGETLDTVGEPCRVRPAPASVTPPLDRGLTRWDDVVGPCRTMASADAPSEDQVDAVLTALRANNIALLKDMNAATKAYAQAAGRASTFAADLGLWMVALGVLLAIVLERTLERRVFRRLQHVRASLARVAGEARDAGSGQDAAVARAGEDEVDSIFRSVDAQCEQIRTFVADVLSCSQGLASAASQLDTSAEGVARDAGQTKRESERMAESFQRIFAEVDALSAATNHVETCMEEVEVAGTQFGQDSRAVDDAVGRAREVVSRANEEAEGAVREVRAMEVVTSEISSVIDTMQEIADQTNLLALNATIESARAGEAGKGFGVVANEVKDLATRSVQAADEIRERLHAIAEAGGRTSSAIQRLRTSFDEVESISTAVAQTAADQRSRSSDMTERLSSVRGRTRGMVEHVAGVVSSNREIEAQIRNVTDQAEASLEHAQQSQAASRETSDAASQLRTLATAFNV